MDAWPQLCLELKICGWVGLRVKCKVYIGVFLLSAFGWLCLVLAADSQGCECPSRGRRLKVLLILQSNQTAEPAPS